MSMPSPGISASTRPRTFVERSIVRCRRTPFGARSGLLLRSLVERRQRTRVPGRDEAQAVVVRSLVDV